MSQNSGTKVIAPIVTPSTLDTFPTHMANTGKGGYHTVKTIADRDNIPPDRREEGMLCGVIDEKAVYQLVGGIENTSWEAFKTDSNSPANATAITYTPSGELEGTNVQLALDELEAEKASITSVYTKDEVDTLFDDLEVDYNDLLNLPDLSSLHEHADMETIEKFTVANGKLNWDGNVVGDMTADIYDADGDGLVDSAKTLDGLTVTPALLNHVDGLTGNIQDQIDDLSLELSTATFFKGKFPTYADMLVALTAPEEGYWVFITQDENYDNAKTQYYFNGTDWIFGGGGSGGGIADPSLIDISDVPYDITDTGSKSLKEIIDELLYVAPNITAFSVNPSVVEKGTSVNSLALTWTINKAITEQSINQGIGVLDKALRTYTVTSPVTNNVTYTLTVNDGKNSVNRTASISFRSKLYWGLSTQTTLTNVDVLTLNSELTTTRVKTVSFNPTNQYIYIAMPTSFGTPSFKVNGLANDAWEVTPLNHINSQNFSENYTIYRSQYVQNGSGINIEIT